MLELANKYIKIVNVTDLKMFRALRRGMKYLKITKLNF